VDVGAKYEIYGIINDLAAQGKAIVVISSELVEILGICDRIYTICEGRITGQRDRKDATQENLMELMTLEGK
jgi:putative multiple sugar transport system ATP-binding protein